MSENAGSGKLVHPDPGNIPFPIVEGTNEGSSVAVSPLPIMAPPRVVDPASAPGPVMSPVVQYALAGRRGSAPTSRRGSQSSQGGGVPTHHSISPSSGMYGGLPPVEPMLNPRRGSATGSFGLPVPPDWVKAHGGQDFRRGSAYKTSPLVGGGDRDSPVHSWFGNVMSGALAAQINTKERVPVPEVKRQVHTLPRESSFPREGEPQIKQASSRAIRLNPPPPSPQLDPDPDRSLANI